MASRKKSTPSTELIAPPKPIEPLAAPRTLHLSLTQPQADLATAPEQFPAIVAGFGAGKTEALSARMLIKKLAYPAGWVGYYAPTYDLINLIAVPRIERILEEHGFPYKMNKSEMILRVHRMGAFVFRTMERPERIVGYECADSAVDELDTLKIDAARAAWVKIIARNRQKKPHGALNTVAIGTTPEGFRFTYDRWVKNGGLGADGVRRYRIIKASTYSNAHNLPAEYIPSLEASYPPALLRAYLNGEFVNLTSGAVYPDFDRRTNHTDDRVLEGDALHVGMDFNVLNMTAVVTVTRNGWPHVVDELTRIRDTPAMAQKLVDRYKAKGHTVIVYPDSSGQNTSSKNASESDISILRQAGLMVRAATHNPAVRDRVNAVNALILNARGERRLKVNTHTCPVLTEALEQQAYDRNGDPDKSTGHDHPADAVGYRLITDWPIHRPISTVAPLRM